MIHHLAQLSSWKLISCTYSYSTGDTEKNVKELRQENAALKKENRDMHQLIARLSAKIDKISNLATEEAI